SGPDLETAARIIPIFLVPLIFAIGTSPSQAVFTALAKVGVPTMAALAGAVVNVVLSVALCKYAGWGLAGLAAGTGSTLAALAIFFIPLYLRRIAGIELRRFCLNSFLPPVALSAAFAVFCGVINAWLAPRSLAQLAVAFAICGVF